MFAARRRSTHPAMAPRIARGTMTMASTVAAIRCSHSAAFSLAGARIEAMRAASGTGMPVIAAPGANAAASSVRTCAASRNVLSHVVRYSTAMPRKYMPASTPSASASAAQ
jgi:hypothetical protein